MTGGVPAAAPRRQPLARGTVQVALADAVVLPAGILTAAYLARALGPGDYGLLMIAMSVTMTIEWALVSMFSRASVKFVSEAEDWRPAAASAFRMQTGVGATVGAGLFLFASPLSHLLHEPALAGLLRWLAIAIPFASAAAACRNVLTGRGHYGERAAAAAIRWGSRPLLVILCVQLGLGLTGAVLGGLLSAGLGWVIAHAYARVPILVRGVRPAASLWRFVLPLFTLALSLRVVDKLGLILLLALGAGTREAGWYAAAQGFCVAPALVIQSFTPLLLGAIALASRQGDAAQLRRLIRNAFRVVAGLVPFMAYGAGAAPEIVRLIFGPAFAPAADLVVPMLAGTFAVATISITSAMLAAGDRARQATTLVWPTVPVIFVALLVAIPRYGAIGAAVVTSAGSIGSAVVLCVATCRFWRVSLPWGTMARSAAVSAAMTTFGYVWPAEGVWLIAKSVAAAAAIPAAFAALREFDATDREMIRGVFRRPSEQAAILE